MHTHIITKISEALINTKLTCQPFGLPSAWGKKQLKVKKNVSESFNILFKGS